MDDNIKTRISEAIADVDTLDNDVDLEVFNYAGYGKEFIKSARCSPDAWLQMSLQLTMFREGFKKVKKQLMEFSLRNFNNTADNLFFPLIFYIIFLNLIPDLLEDWWQPMRAPPPGGSDWAELTASEQLTPRLCPGAGAWTMTS